MSGRPLINRVSVTAAQHRRALWLPVMLQPHTRQARVYPTPRCQQSAHSIPWEIRRCRLDVQALPSSQRRIAREGIVRSNRIPRGNLPDLQVPLNAGDFSSYTAVNSSCGKKKMKTRKEKRYPDISTSMPDRALNAMRITAPQVDASLYICPFESCDCSHRVETTRVACPGAGLNTNSQREE